MLKRELKINLKSLIIWTTVAIIFFLTLFIIFPMLVNEENMALIEEMMNLFPPELLQAMNIDLTGFDSVFAIFKTEGMHMFLLIGSMYAATLGGTILLKEESDKTIEYLYSKPVSRNQIISSKVICALINILLYTLLVMLVNLIGLTISGDIEFGLFLRLSLAPLIIFYTSFFIMLLISTLFSKTKIMVSLGIGLVFLSFMFYMLGGMSDQVDFLQYLSIFRLASARDIIISNAIDWIAMLVGIIIIGITIFLTYLRYNKKELV